MLVCKSNNSDRVVKLDDNTTLENGKTYTAREVLNDILSWDDSRNKSRTLERFLSREYCSGTFQVLDYDSLKDTHSTTQKAALFEINITFEDDSVGEGFEKTITVISPCMKNVNMTPAQLYGDSLPATLLDVVSTELVNEALFDKRLLDVLIDIANFKTPDEKVLKDTLRIPNVKDELVKIEILRTVIDSTLF